MNNGAISFDVLINNSDFQRKFDEMERRVRGMSSNVVNEGKKIDDALSRINTSIAAYITFDGIKQLGQELINVRAEFQSLETSFKVMLGSKEKANQLMSQIAQLASSTPFGLQDVAQASKMLLAYGGSAKTVVDETRMIGDVASGAGIPLKDLAQIYGSVRTNQVAFTEDVRQFAGRGLPIYKELANILGIAEEEVNSFASAGKIRFAEIEKAFQNMTSAGGIFYKATEEQSITINGLTSTLKDGFEDMFNNIGKSQEGFITDALKLGISATKNYQKIIDTLTVLVATYGAYKTAVIVTTAVESASISIKGGWTIAQLAQYRALLLTENAQKLLNTTMLANPYVLATTLLVGLAASLYTYSKYTDYAVIAQEKFNQKIEDITKKQDTYKQKTSELMSIVSSETTNRQKQADAFLKLKGMYPEALKNLDLYKFMALGAADAQKILNEALDGMKFNDLKKEISSLDKVISDTQAQIKNQPAVQTSFGSMTNYYDLLKKLAQTKELRKKFALELNLLKRQERSSREEAEKFTQQPIIKNEQWYDDEIKKLKQLQSKYNGSSKESADLQKKIAALSKEKDKYFGSNSSSDSEKQAPFGSIRYWEQVAQKAKEAVSNATSDGSRAKFLAEQLDAERKAEELKKQLSVQSFEDQINEKKKQYELYEKWVQYVSKDSANSQFAELLKSGKSYEAFLKSQIDTFKAQIDKGTINEDGKKKFYTLTVEYDSLQTGKPILESFKSSLEKTKNEAQNLTEYLSYLKQLQAELTGDNSQLGEQKRVEVANRINETQQKISENLKQFLENSSNYEQQILNIQKKYSDLRLANESQFTDKKNADYLKNKELINLEEKKELNEVDKYRIQNLDSYKKLQESVYQSNRDGIKKRLQNEKEALEDIKKKYGEQSEEFKKLAKQIIKTQEELDRSTIESINSFASLAGELGQALSQIEGSFGQVGKMLSGLASSTRAISVSFDKQATTTDKVQAGISGIISLTNLVISAANQRNAKEKEYQQNAIAFEHEYKVLLNERLGTQTQLNENVFVKDYQGRLTDSFKMFSDASSKYKQALGELSKGQAKIGLQNQLNLGNIGTAVGSGAALGAAVGSIVPVLGTAIGAAVGAGVGAIVGIFAGKTKEDTYGELLKLYPDLIKEASDGQKVFNKDLATSLITTGQVDEATKQLLENTLTWVDQMEKAKDAVKTIIQELAGNLGNNLRDSLVNAFKEGTSAAEAFGQSVSSILEDLLSKIIFNQVFSDAFDKLQAQLEASQNILGGENDWMQAFGEFFQQADGLWQQFYQGLQAAQDSANKYGLKLFQKSSSSGGDSLSGAIKSITAEQASLLAGQFNAIRINTASMVSLNRDAVSHLQQIASYNVQYLPYLKTISDKIDSLSSADSMLRSKGLLG